MKYYKDIILKTTKDAKLGHFHMWTPESIKQFWEVWHTIPSLRPLHPRYFYEDLIRNTKEYLRDIGTAIDVGCGSGIVLEILVKQRIGQQLVGIDMSERSLESMASGRFKSYTQLSFILGNIVELPLEAESCDLVICTEVFEHLFPDDYVSGLNEISRILKPQGYLLGTTPLNEKMIVAICPECHTIFHPHQHLLFEIDPDWLKQELNRFKLEIIKFVHPIEPSIPRTWWKRILKHRIIIPFFPTLAMRLFPTSGVSGFLARKIR